MSTEQPTELNGNEGEIKPEIKTKRTRKPKTDSKEIVAPTPQVEQTTQEKPQEGTEDLLSSLTKVLERDLRGEQATEEEAFERQQKAYELFKIAFKSPEILNIYESTTPENLSDLESGVTLGIISKETVDKYKKAIEIMKQTEEVNPTHPILEELKNAIDKTYEEFQQKALFYIEEKKAERTTRLNEYFAKHQPRMQEYSERIRDLDKNPSVVEKLKDFFRARDMIIEDEISRKKFEKEEAQKKQEAEELEKEMAKRDEILRDWQGSIDSVGTAHRKVFENLQKVLPAESFVKLQTIIEGFVSTLNTTDSEAIAKIRTMIVRHIADSPEDSLSLKTPYDLIPWFQRPGATYRYSDAFGMATNENIKQIRNEAKEKGTKITTLTTEEKMDERMKKTEKENAILRILIGSREKSPIWVAFEQRRELKEKGKLEEFLEKRKKSIEEAQKREEQRRIEIAEQEKTRMAFEGQLKDLSEDPCSASFVAPIYETKIHQGVREIVLVKREELLINFVPSKSRRGNIMIKVNFIIDKNAKSFEGSYLSEVSGLQNGRTFDLETLSGAPQWIKNGMSDTTKANIKITFEESEKK